MRQSTPWSDPKSLRQQVDRLWERGIIPRAVVQAGDGFPIRLALKGPSSKELVDEFESVRIWIGALRGMRGIRFEWRDIRHRILGQQAIPSEAWLDDLDETLVLIGRRQEAARLQEIVRKTGDYLPALVSFVQKRPLDALSFAAVWDDLLALVAWILDHPRPAIYLRQIDLPGIHTKFIESHLGILADLVSWVDPKSAGDRPIRASSFAGDLGFLEKPVRIRFRILDPELDFFDGAQGIPDITLDQFSFANLRLGIDRVFIVENEINFLSFPELKRSLIIFGAGYGFEALSKASWLNRVDIFYWGDIDTHGFAILNQLRAHFPKTQSFLMDAKTFEMYRWAWVEEKSPKSHALDRLTPAECALYDALCDQRYGKNLRLEQERIGYSYATRVISNLSDDSCVIAHESP